MNSGPAPNPAPSAPIPQAGQQIATGSVLVLRGCASRLSLSFGHAIRSCRITQVRVVRAQRPAAMAFKARAVRQQNPFNTAATDGERRTWRNRTGEDKGRSFLKSQNAPTRVANHLSPSKSARMPAGHKFRDGERLAVLQRRGHGGRYEMLIIIAGDSPPGHRSRAVGSGRIQVGAEFARPGPVRARPGRAACRHRRRRARTSVRASPSRALRRSRFAYAVTVSAWPSADAWPQQRGPVCAGKNHLYLVPS